MYKKVVVLQSCYFANLPIAFCRSRCGRRRHCLSSPLLWSRNFATIVAWRHTSPLHCNDKRESWDREENTQSSPWDKYVNFSNLKREINQKMVSGEVHKYLFSTVVKKGFNNSHLQLQHSTFFLLWGSRSCTWWRFKQTIKIRGPIPGIVLPFNYNDSKNNFISEIHMSRPAPYYSLTFQLYNPLRICVLHCLTGGTDYRICNSRPCWLEL